MTAATRYQQALDRHHGNAGALVSELEIAYARWMANPQDTAARDEWKSLVLACTNAGEAAISASPQAFARLATVLVTQLRRLPKETVEVLTPQLQFLAEDLADVDIPELARFLRGSGAQPQ